MTLVGNTFAFSNRTPSIHRTLRSKVRNPVTGALSRLDLLRQTFKRVYPGVGTSLCCREGLQRLLTPALDPGVSDIGMGSELGQVSFPPSSEHGTEQQTRSGRMKQPKRRCARSWIMLACASKWKERFRLRLSRTRRIAHRPPRAVRHR